MIPRCVKTLSRLAHGTQNKGFVRTTTESWKSAFNGTCNYTKNKDKNKIAAKWDVYRRSKDGTYKYCAGSAWYYNPSSTWSYSVYYNFPTVPCKWGAYRARSSSFVKQHGNWKGGSTWSPPHSFPP